MHARTTMCREPSTGQQISAVRRVPQQSASQRSRSPSQRHLGFHGQRKICWRLATARLLQLHARGGAHHELGSSQVLRKRRLHTTRIMRTCGRGGAALRPALSSRGPLSYVVENVTFFQGFALFKLNMMKSSSGKRSRCRICLADLPLLANADTKIQMLNGKIVPLRNVTAIDRLRLFSGFGRQRKTCWRLATARLLLYARILKARERIMSLEQVKFCESEGYTPHISYYMHGRGGTRLARACVHLLQSFDLRGVISHALGTSLCSSSTRLMPFSHSDRAAMAFHHFVLSPPMPTPRHRLPMTTHHRSRK